MPAGRKRNVTSAEALRRGAAQLYNDAFNRAGGGARGRAAGERAVAGAFPGIGKDVIGRIAKSADERRKLQQRYGPAGANYQLPKEAHQERECERKAPPGGRRQRYYIYSVEVEVHVIVGGQILFTHLSRNEIQCPKPCTRGEIEARAKAAAEIEARFYLASSWKRFGNTVIQVGKVTISAAETCLM